MRPRVGFSGRRTPVKVLERVFGKLLRRALDDEKASGASGRDGDPPGGDDSAATAPRRINSRKAPAMRVDESEEFLRGALAFDENELGENHPAMTTTLRRLGECVSREGRTEEAEEYFRRAVAIEEKRPGPVLGLASSFAALLGSAWHFVREMGGRSCRRP